MTTARKIGLAAALLGGSLVIVLGGVATISAKGPYWLGLNADPDYAYLLNALNVARGLPPYHVDHPGTPVQILVALVLRTAYLFSDGPDLVTVVLAQSESYLRLINYLLLAAYVAALAGLGALTWRATKSTAAVMLAQLAPVFSTTIPAHFACVKPEPVLLILSAILAALTMVWVGRPDGSPGKGLMVAFGLLAGTAVATKITSAPLVLVPALLVSRRRDLGVLAGGAFVAAALFTAPAWARIIATVKFAGRIATHAGHYGQGQVSMVEPTLYLRTLGGLLWSEPVLSCALIGAVLAIALDRRRLVRGLPNVRRGLLALIVAQIGCLLLVARHPSDQFLAPGDNYLVPALGLIGPVLALTWSLVAGRPARLGLGISGAAVIAGLALAIAQCHGFCVMCRHLAMQRDAQLAVAQAVQQHRGQRQVIHYYRSSSPAYALYFGDSFAGRHYGRDIAALYPERLYFDVWSKRLESVFHTPATIGETKALLQGSVVAPDVLDPQVLGINRRLILRSGSEWLYELN